MPKLSEVDYGTVETICIALRGIEFGSCCPNFAKKDFEELKERYLHPLMKRLLEKVL